MHTELFRACICRKFQRGLKRQPLALIKRLRKTKKEAPPLEKPEEMATQSPDDNLLQQHMDKLPDYLNWTFIEAVVFHPVINEGDMEKCREYIKKLQHNINDNNQKSSYIIELYDDLELGSVSKTEKLEYVNKCSAYKLIYLTSDFHNREEEQKFYADSALAVSLGDPTRRESVLVVRQNKEVKVPSYLSMINSLVDDEKEDYYHYDKMRKLFMSEKTVKKRKQFEEETKKEQIEWIKKNVV